MRRRHHRERLGERERPEHAAFLSLEQEDGHERHDDDREREEDRRATCLAAATIAARLLSVRAGASSDTCRYAFSTITIDASTSTPMASASPPSDMMFDVTPR